MGHVINIARDGNGKLYVFDFQSDENSVFLELVDNELEIRMRLTTTMFSSDLWTIMKLSPP